MTGITAYYVSNISTLLSDLSTLKKGLVEIGQIKAGETLVVSGAAGATGSVVCQLGKLLGAKVIAIAGADDKCKWLEDDLGVDKALNYKSPTFKKDFRDSVGYLDVYFDNGAFQVFSNTEVTNSLIPSWWRDLGPVPHSLEQECENCTLWRHLSLQ